MTHDGNHDAIPARPGRRPFAVAAVAVAGALLALAFLSAPLWDARWSMHAGREATLQAVGGYQAGDMASGRVHLDRAGAHFAKASDRLAIGRARLAARLPVVGAEVVAADQLAKAAGELVAGGAVLLDWLDDEAEGLAAFGPRDGRVPLEPYERLLPVLEQAAAAVDRAEGHLAQAADLEVRRSVDAARSELALRVEQTRRLVDSASAVVAVLPRLLGADRPKHYFFASTNPAELRGSGGLLGAFSVLTVDEGRILFGPFQATQAVSQDETAALPPPDPSYERRYGTFGGHTFWPNINMTPDFPTAARAMEQLHTAVLGEPLDGTIAATPAALQSLLALTGPVDVVQLGLLDAGNAEQILANEAYGEFSDEDTRKRVLGQAAATVFERFLAGGSDPELAARTLLAALSSGDLMLHAADDEVQAALEGAGVAGSLPVDQRNVTAVVVNNAAANKVDFYTDREVIQEVWLDADGSALSSTRVTFANHAPVSGLPTHVIGPNVDYLDAGDNYTHLSLYAGPDWELVSAARDGDRLDVDLDEELGLPVHTAWLWLPSGGRTTVTYLTRAHRAWSPSDSATFFEVAVRDQPTIRPAPWTVVVHGPDGWTVRGLSDGTHGGAVARWSGVAPRTVELRFQLEPAGRGPGRIVELLRRPVVRIGQ